MKLLQQKSCCNIWYLLQWNILLRKLITTEFIAMAKTYYHRVYCNGLQRLTFVAIKVYCNKMKVIVTKNSVAINLFSCSGEGFYHSMLGFSRPTNWQIEETTTQYMNLS